eukprot:CAMPEP_0179217326 /NCGR_PEP_ID=MMETSP0797-20121207/3862_1 /TAXON_ID=47934 /ORGANISM="Dinophysis acuminata, Strain DAEP01" /LENGTH=295 /DNA_ID=CAMNT_0020923563 /DNA_START=69 /DNA_END=952 /DNA_ORIENTATION=-
MAALGLPEFLAVVIPSVLIALIMYIIFGVCRCKFDEIYAPRTTKAMHGVEWEQAAQKLAPGFMSWLDPLLKISPGDVAEKSGMDAVGYIAFQRMMCVIFAVLTIFCWIVLFPVYGTGENDLGGFDRVTMSNLKQDSKRLWAAAVIMWPASVTVYFLFYKTCDEVASVVAGEEHRAVRYWHQVTLVSGIPEDQRTEDLIRTYFNEVYPGQVSHIQLVKHLGKEYEKSFAKYTKAWRGLKRAELAARATPDKPPMTRTMPLCGKKVEAVPHFAGQCGALRKQLEARRQEYDDIPATP